MKFFKLRKDFQGFINRSRFGQINFWLIFLILLLLPMPLTYLDLEITPGRPVIRDLKIDFNEISSYPVNYIGQTAPWLSAVSALVIDVPSKTIIYAKNPDIQLLPASTTKIMTALVSLDYYQLSQILEVKNLKAEGQTMKLEEGEKLYVESLLYGLLVQSGNDAAEVLADNYSGGRENFIKAMNEKAKKLHLEKTNFINPTGIDEANHHTTVHDLAVLASEAMKNQIFSQIVATSEIEIMDTSGQKKHLLKNVNSLLGKVSGLQGIKTGWTESAGECLVAYTQRNNQKIITVILASQDRFGETTKLIDWVFGNFKWESIPANPQ